MNIRIRLCVDLRQAVIERLQQAYQNGQVRQVRRIHALMSIIEGKSVDEVAITLGLGAQTVRDYVKSFLWCGVASLSCRKPAGRPPKLTKTQKRGLIAPIKAGPEAAGYTTGCWSAVLIQNLLWCTFGVEYHLVKTSGKRKAYKVLGLIDYRSGRLFWHGQTERFNSGSYADFLTKVLTQTQQHIILIQDGARYHTSCSWAQHTHNDKNALRLCIFAPLR
jgi:transposase